MTPDASSGGASRREPLPPRPAETRVGGPAGGRAGAGARERGERRPPPWYPAVKRALDVVLSAVQAVVCLPAWVFVPLAVKLEDGGPVFFAQERVGRGGELFTSWKFRSMTPREADAERGLGGRPGEASGPAAFGSAATRRERANHAHREPSRHRRGPDGREGPDDRGGRERPDGRASGPLKQADLEEDRVTRVGAVLRATALDELPQLWNIFVGEMSYVGPRALLPEERSAARGGELVRMAELPGYEERHGVRPGLTGLAQVRLPRDASHVEKFRLDLRYVRTRSLGLDLRLILESVWISLRGAWPEVGRDGGAPRGGRDGGAARGGRDEEAARDDRDGRGRPGDRDGGPGDGVGGGP